MHLGCCLMGVGQMQNDERLSSGLGSYRRVAQDLVGAVPEGGVLRLSVTSNSMRPLLRPGDMVVAEVIAPGALQCGDIVVVRRDGELITHRFIMAGAQGWRTRGDNACGPDPAVAAQMIVGRGVTIERGDQVIDLRLGRWPLLNRWLGRLGRIELRLWDTGRAMKRKGTLALAGSRMAFIGSIAGWPLRTLNRVILSLAIER